jgi:hypothetical protein
VTELTSIVVVLKNGEDGGVEKELQLDWDQQQSPSSVRLSSMQFSGGGGGGGGTHRMMVKTGGLFPTVYRAPAGGGAGHGDSFQNYDHDIFEHKSANACNCHSRVLILLLLLLMSIAKLLG